MSVHYCQMDNLSVNGHLHMSNKMVPAADQQMKVRVSRNPFLRNLTGIASVHHDSLHH
jgi:hypothetical protein